MNTVVQKVGEADGVKRHAVKDAIVNLRRRRSYLTDAKTQFTINRQFLFVLVVTSALSVGNYHVFKIMMGVDTADSFDQILALGYCALLVAISASLLFLLCVFFTHRIAGPARKISEALDQMANKNLCVKVRLRDTDLLTELAEAVNVVNRDLRTALLEISGEVQRAIKLADNDSELAGCIRRIERQLDTFRITNAAEIDARQAVNRGAVSANQKTSD